MVLLATMVAVAWLWGSKATHKVITYATRLFT